MLPTHVGMSLFRLLVMGVPHSAPHTRGDEPECSSPAVMQKVVLPTHVGMSRCSASSRWVFPCARHTRGDGVRRTVATARK